MSHHVPFPPGPSLFDLDVVPVFLTRYCRDFPISNHGGRRHAVIRYSARCNRHVRNANCLHPRLDPHVKSPFSLNIDRTNLILQDLSEQIFN